MKPSQVRVVPAESSLIEIEPFDPAAHPNFVATIDRVEHPEPGQEVEIASYSVVITNRAAHSVESLVIRWSVAGDSKPRNLILEGYLNPPRRPILGPGEQLLVNPSGAFPQTLPEAFFTFSLPGPYGFFPLTNIVDGKLRLESRGDASVEAIVDSAIFDDGTMIGSDRFGIAAFLRERQSAVKALIARVEEAAASGKTVDEALSDYPVIDGRHHQAERLVHQVRRNPAFLDFLKQLRELSPDHP
jgi:hypothetical protein